MSYAGKNDKVLVKNKLITNNRSIAFSVSSYMKISQFYSERLTKLRRDTYYCAHKMTAK